MQVEKAEYCLDQGRPSLRLMIDGHPAVVTDVNWSLLQLGYVALVSPAEVRSDYWSNVLPEVHLPPNKILGNGEITLRGVTNDERVVRLVRNFCRAVNEEDGQEYKPGPVLLSTDRV